MKYTDIAKRENVNESTIRCSIQSALSRLENQLKKLGTEGRFSRFLFTVIERDVFFSRLNVDNFISDSLDTELSMQRAVRRIREDCLRGNP